NFNITSAYLHCGAIPNLNSFPTRRSSDLASPTVMNYTPDKAVIGGETATIQQPKYEYVVTYSPNKKNARRQKAEIKFIDVDDNKDRKSTRLNSSHVSISYAVFCLKKKNKN